MQSGSLNPAALPPGTWVGPWRIVDLRGGGAHGVVYLVRGDSGEAALKLALKPLDVRFGREVALLSRIRSPSVPRILDNGEWVPPEGAPRPYLVMEWVEGVPLYVWARDRKPSSRQVLQVLAGVARALAATHAVGGVHRDVKGDNMLVRLKDGQAFLIDFGSSRYKEAEPITGTVFPPSTREYRSPEAIRFAVNILQSQTKVYTPKPADDVFALGVTAYRLVTGEYPPTADPSDAGAEVWEGTGTGPVPARELNAQCHPELSRLISRMLSREPSARGSARELAEALEHAAREVGEEVDAPLLVSQTHRPVEQASPPPQSSFHLPWLLTASLGGLAVIWGLSTTGRDEVAPVQAVQQEDARDAGTVAAGDSLLTSVEGFPHQPSTWMPISMDIPAKPLSGQIRPDASGRCPHKSLLAINGGCWKKTDQDPKDCSEFSYLYKGACYMPAMHRQHSPTSSPVESRDGGR